MYVKNVELLQMFMVGMFIGMCLAILLIGGRFIDYKQALKYCSILDKKEQCLNKIEIGKLESENKKITSQAGRV